MAYRQERLTSKTPVEAYQACPYCKSKNLMPFEEEVFCLDCNWDSIAIHAELTPLGYTGRRPTTSEAPASPSSLAVNPASQKPTKRHPALERNLTEELITCANYRSSQMN